jgi:hypothetical protein
MFMNVQVKNPKSGKIVGVYPISMSGLNYRPTDKEFFDMAQRAALDDGAVKQSDLKDLHYSFVESGRI